MDSQEKSVVLAAVSVMSRSAEAEGKSCLGMWTAAETQ